MCKFQDTYFGWNKNGGLSKRIYEEKGKSVISRNKKHVYPSPSLGCFPAYITINAVLVCLEWDVKDWQWYCVFVWFQSPVIANGFSRAVCVSTHSASLVGRAPSLSPSPTRTDCPSLGAEPRSSSCVLGCQERNTNPNLQKHYLGSF